MRLSNVLGVLKLLAVASVCGCAFVGWLTSSFYGAVGIVGWRAIAVIVSFGLGAIGVLTVGSWIRVGIAAAIGFIGGATWVEWRFSDVGLGLAESMWNALVLYGRDALGLSIAASVTGAFLTQMIWRRAWPKRE